MRKIESRKIGLGRPWPPSASLAVLGHPQPPSATLSRLRPPSATSAAFSRPQPPSAAFGHPQPPSATFSRSQPLNTSSWLMATFGNYRGGLEMSVFKKRKQIHSWKRDMSHAFQAIKTPPLSKCVFLKREATQIHTCKIETFHTLFKL